jgi:hypothetical protein
MTGRDLILYILMNNLEDEPVFEEGKFIGFVTDVEAAEKLGVGTATIRVWINQGLLDGVRINDNLYIRADFKPPEVGNGK